MDFDPKVDWEYLHIEIAREFEQRRLLRSDKILLRHDVRVALFREDDYVAKIYYSDRAGKSSIWARSLNAIKLCLQQYEQHLTDRDYDSLYSLYC